MSKDGLRKRFFTKKRIILFIIIVIFFFIGKSIFFGSKNNISNSSVVKRGDIREELALSGEVYAEDHVVLRFETIGRVNWVGVKEGDWVKKGQAIATLDKETLDAALRQAWQNFTAAKAASDKYYDGRKGKSEESYSEKIERTALDATQNVAYDNVRIAQENLKSAELYSPINGLVVEADPSLAGVNVTALSSASYEVVDPSTVYIKVTADQTEVGELKNGQTGTIIFDSYLDEKIKGTIKDISFAPAKDETGTVYDVKIIISDANNNDYKYRLGMTADVNFVLKENNNTLIIPSEYIKSDGSKKFVLVGKSKKKTFVKIGIESEQNTEIVEGLSEGDKVYD
jgi:RND family efflux transporter MFP subunit